MLKNKLLILWVVIFFLFISFSQSEPYETLIPIDEFYQYDKKMLLNAKEETSQQLKYINIVLLEVR